MYSVRESAKMSLEYWISTIALFHEEAEKILRDNEVEIFTHVPKSVTYFENQFDKTRKVNGIKFNKSMLKDSIDYIVESDNSTLIHRDLHGDNLFGKYLVDLDTCEISNPGIDLAMLLMQYNVPTQHWNRWVEMYCEVREIDQRTEEGRKTVGEIYRGTIRAVPYIATKEILGSSENKMCQKTEERNAKFAQYLLAA